MDEPTLARQLNAIILLQIVTVGLLASIALALGGTGLLLVAAVTVVALGVFGLVMSAVGQLS